MAKTTNWNCDGCGMQAEGAEAVLLPDGWDQITVTLESEEGDEAHELDRSFDLCRTCTDRLVHDANPLKWVRPALRAA